MKRNIFLFFFFYIFFVTFSYNFDCQIDKIEVNYKPGIYYNDIVLNVKPQNPMDTLYYIYENSFREADPILLNSSLNLVCNEGFKKDYRIKLILINNRNVIDVIELFYTIDKTDSYKIDRKEIGNNSLVEKNIAPNIFQYSTNDNVYYSKDRSINLSKITVDKIFQNDFKKDRKILVGYNLEDDIVLKYIENSLVKPDLGFIRWGKVLSQNIKINIKNPNNTGETYFWFKEFNKNDILYGPPSDLTKWKLFTNDIDIGLNDSEKIYCIASYIKKENFYSEISGPYYFKVDSNSNEVQFVDDINKEKDAVIESKDETEKNRKVFINSVELKNRYVLINSNKIKINITELSRKNYYISLLEGEKTGKIQIVSNEDFFFETDKNEAILEIYDENNILINKILFGNKIENIPAIVDYKADYIESNGDITLQIYSPFDVKNCKILVYDKDRKLINEFNEIPENIELKSENDKYIEIHKNNRLAKRYLVHFIKNESSIFDNIKINFDSSRLYNSKIDLVISGIPDRYRILYSFDNINYFNYRDKITLNPPIGVISKIKVYLKLLDSIGNAINEVKEITYNFDTRAIFVDSKQNKSGIGTIVEPVKTIEEAIKVAEKSKINVINILSKENFVYKKLNINTDLIIQGYGDDEITLNLINNFGGLDSFIKMGKGTFLEFRNLNINISETRNFTIIGEDSKVVFYYCKIDFIGKKIKLKFINTDQSDVGFKNCRFLAYKTEDFQFFDGKNCNIVMENIDFYVFSNKTIFVNDEKSNIRASNINFFNDISKGKFVFIKSNEGNFDLYNINFEVKSKNSNLVFFDINNSKLISNYMNIVLDDENSFDIKVLNCRNSSINIDNNQYKISGGISSTLFYCEKSNVDINQSIFDTAEQEESNCNIKSYKSVVKISSSIFKNSKTGNNINVINNNGVFEGVNNTFIVDSINEKSYNFYLSDKASLITINSIYYNNQQKEGNLFLFYNGELKNINVIWSNNIISNSYNLIDINSKDNYSYIQDSFNINNKYFENKLFDLSKDYYFIPIDLSIIGNSGIIYSEDYAIPENDFFGNLRNVNGYGIDIGAIQVTGYNY